MGAICSRGGIWTLDVDFLLGSSGDDALQHGECHIVRDLCAAHKSEMARAPDRPRVLRLTVCAREHDVFGVEEACAARRQRSAAIGYELEAPEHGHRARVPRAV